MAHLCRHEIPITLEECSQRATVRLDYDSSPAVFILLASRQIIFPASSATSTIIFRRLQQIWNFRSLSADRSSSSWRDLDAMEEDVASECAVEATEVDDSIRSGGRRLEPVAESARKEIRGNCRRISASSLSVGYILFIVLGAPKHLYNWLCRSVCRWVG